MKIIRVITSCITFNCISVKGPPLPTKPIRLAGIWHEYSAKAMAHEKRITRYKGQDEMSFICCNFRWPYHAKVIKTFDTTSNRMVYNAFILI